MSVVTLVHRSLLLTAVLCASEAGTALADESSSVATACLRRSDIRTTKILSDRNVLFITRDRTTYVNQLARQCPGMRRNSAMSFTYSGNGKLCTGSLFNVLYRSGASTNMIPYTNPLTNEHSALQGPAFLIGPTCQLGMFGPVTDEEVKVLMAVTDEPKPSRRRGERDAVKTEPVEAAPPALLPFPKL